MICVWTCKSAPFALPLTAKRDIPLIRLPTRPRRTETPFITKPIDIALTIASSGQWVSRVISGIGHETETAPPRQTYAFATGGT